MRASILLALILAGSCRQNTPPEVRNEQGVQGPAQTPREHGPAVVIHTRGNGRVRVEVEVARTDPQRMRGLMYRREMAEDHGMIFMFREASHQTFWMRNTLLPLDMIFIRPDNTILGVVRNATPETDDPRDVPGDSQYVLEVNGGFCQRHNVMDGDRLDFIEIPGALD